MRTYLYRVLLPHGALKMGVLRLAVERDQSARIRLEADTDGTVLNLWRVPSVFSLGGDFFTRITRTHVRPEDLAGFLRDMGLMLRAGVSASAALKTLIEETAETSTNAITDVAKRMAYDLRAGVSMSEAFARQPHVFPETVRNLIAIGDQSGKLAEMLTESAEHVERIMTIRRDIRTAMIYPAFVFATILGVAAFWIYYVVPNMALLFRQLNAKLPPLTRNLVAFSDLVVNNAVATLLVLAVVVAVVAWCFFRFPKVRGWVDETLHRVPIARVLMTASGMAHISEHLALLVRAGIDFVGSLDILARSTGDRYYRWRLIKVRDAVARGEGIASAMRRTGGFPPMAVRMIAVGEESGSLDVQLTHLAQEYRKRLENVIRSLSEIIKPAIILLAGGLFIFLIVALLLPVYDLVRQSVQSSMGGR